MSVRRVGAGKWLGAAVAALLLIAATSGTSFADMRIVSESDDERFELLIKNDRILSRDDITSLILNCTTEEVTYVYSRYYWQGPVPELTSALEAALARILDEDAGSSGASAFLGALFGSSSSTSTQVRVTPVGDDTVAGYKATQYRVETGQAAQWKTHEIVSISTDLLREIKTEVGDCIDVMMDLSHRLAALVPLGDAPIVYSDPDYPATLAQGFPVRSITKMTVFGIELEAESALVEVSRAPIADDEFALPANSRRVENLDELL